MTNIKNDLLRSTSTLALLYSTGDHAPKTMQAARSAAMAQAAKTALQRHRQRRVQAQTRLSAHINAAKEAGLL